MLSIGNTALVGLNGFWFLQRAKDRAGPEPALKQAVASVIGNRLSSANVGSPLATHCSFKYLAHGYLNFDDVLCDGVVTTVRTCDPNCDWVRLLSASPSPAQETLVMDSQQDKELQVCNAFDSFSIHSHDRKRWQASIKDPKFVSPTASCRERVLRLGQAVSAMLGGFPDDLVQKSTQNVTDAQRLTGSHAILIGHLKFGVCRHRAILFKYLADYLNREEKRSAQDPRRFRVRVVRGYHGQPDDGAHVWNVVEICEGLHDEPF